MPLSKATVNAHLARAEYAVRGAIVQRADAIKADLAAGKGAYNFKKLIYCNIGNPQALKQKPLTFPREVLALMSAPHLLESPKACEAFAPDAVARAKDRMTKMATGSGAYTHSAGYQFARDSVAEFITKRDNAAAGKDLGACNPAEVYLTNGASPAVQMSLQALINGPNDGIMIPIPQYPLYTATITLMNGAMVPYYLDESKGWAMTVADLEASFAKAEEKGVTPRALVIINPGNPTGQVLDKAVMVDVAKFCHQKGIMLLSDEVYQENIYAEGKKFHSFREVLLGMGAPYANEVQLMSFHTTSKGIFGECGRRGGYLQTTNFPSEVLADFIKLPSINLCPNVAGQIMMDLMVEQPKVGDASYDSFKAEYDAIFASLKSRSKMVVEELNKIPGLKTNAVEGAMYAYPSLKLPAKYVETAKSEGKAPDAKWCMQLLEEHGIVVVPGSGFGQVEGTYHFRTTILPPEEELQEMTQRIGTFQKSIIAEWGPIE